jgi:hypothetical protein
MEIQENVKVSGQITASFYDQASLGWIDKGINKLLRALRDKFPEIIRFYRLGRLVQTETGNNVICNAGYNALTRRLCNDTTYTGFINKMALGTGTPTPNAADVKLQTEVYRNNTASYTASSNIAYLTAYFTETECNGTYTEFGNFIDGTGTADSGLIWSHKASISWVKNSVTCLVVSCKYTFA